MNEEKKLTVIRAIACNVRLSEPTVRKAFAGQPTTWKTARVLSNALNIPMECFCVQVDGRRNNGGIRR